MLFNLDIFEEWIIQGAYAKDFSLVIRNVNCRGVKLKGSVTC